MTPEEIERLISDGVWEVANDPDFMLKIDKQISDVMLDLLDNRESVIETPTTTFRITAG